MFDTKVEFVTVRLPLFEIAPPEPLEEFWLKLEFVIFIVVLKSEKIAPPPLLPKFEVKATFVTVKLPRLSIAAPPLPLRASVSVKSLIVAVSPVETKNICTALLPLTVSRFVPVPEIAKESPVAGLIVMGLARVIVLAVPNDESNKIVSEPAAAFESKTACRKLPGPVSFVLVTVKVAAVSWHAAPIKMSMLVASAFGNDLVVVIGLSSFAELLAIYPKRERSGDPAKFLRKCFVHSGVPSPCTGRLGGRLTVLAEKVAKVPVAAVCDRPNRGNSMNKHGGHRPPLQREIDF